MGPGAYIPSLLAFLSVGFNYHLCEVQGKVARAMEYLRGKGRIENAYPNLSPSTDHLRRTSASCSYLTPVPSLVSPVGHALCIDGPSILVLVPDHAFWGHAGKRLSSLGALIFLIPDAKSEVSIPVIREYVGRAAAGRRTGCRGARGH